MTLGRATDRARIQFNFFALPRKRDKFSGARNLCPLVFGVGLLLGRQEKVLRHSEGVRACAMPAQPMQICASQVTTGLRDVVVVVVVVV